MDKCRSLVLSNSMLNILVINLPQREFKNLRPANGDVICQFSNSSMCSAEYLRLRIRIRYGMVQRDKEIHPFSSKSKSILTRQRELA